MLRLSTRSKPDPVGIITSELIINNKTVELRAGGGGVGARREGRVKYFPWFLFWTNNTIHQWREGGVRAAL